MPGRKSVVRKLTLVVIAIVTLVIAAAGLVNDAISHHYALESAREVLKFNSESILNGIHKLMLSRNNEGVLEMIRGISKDSTVYREIRLVSHYSGEVVVSRLGEGSATLTEEDHSCAICHDQPGTLVTSDTPLDDVVDTPGGGRILRVSTPIMPTKASCSEADCHAHAESGPTLGFLEVEYSLEKIDALLFGSNASFVVAAVTAIVLGAMALLIMFERSLGKPIRYMISGIQAVAGDDLSFRFRTDREDEFGLVEEVVRPDGWQNRGPADRIESWQGISGGDRRKLGRLHHHGEYRRPHRDGQPRSGAGARLPERGTHRQAHRGSLRRSQASGMSPSGDSRVRTA